MRREMTLRCVTGRQLAKRNLSVAGVSIYINVTGEERALASGFMPNCKHELYETKAYRWGHVCPWINSCSKNQGVFIEFVNAAFRNKLCGGINPGPRRLCLTLTLKWILKSKFYPLKTAYPAWNWNITYSDLLIYVWNLFNPVYILRNRRLASCRCLHYAQFCAAVSSMSSFVLTSVLSLALCRRMQYDHFYASV
jgi:hypothetical protein